MKVKELKEVIEGLPDDYEVQYKSDAYEYDSRGGHETNWANRIFVYPKTRRIVLE